MAATHKKNASSAKGKILVVDDEPALVDIYTTKLTLEGYNVLSAGDGTDAITLTKKEKPALVLLDVILPKMNGFEVLTALKQDSATKTIPVIILSNLGQDAEVQKGMELGADGFLVKANITPAQVTEEVARVLAKH